jgi:hypothetical protein
MVMPLLLAATLDVAAGTVAIAIDPAALSAMIAEARMARPLRMVPPYVP